MKCPVCEKKIDDITEDHMDNILLERYAVCKNTSRKHYYSYHYHVGQTEEIIGRVTFHSHYEDDDSSIILQSAQYNAVLNLEKRFYKEQKSKENINEVTQCVKNWFINDK